MNRTVLVVDDDRHMVRTLCDLLRKRGWSPHGVHSGEEAVAAAARSRYAAVLMDVRMAGIDGVSAFRAIRERQPRLPVMLMTAYSTRELLAEAERLGVLHIFPKPLPLAQLLSLLDGATSGGERVLLVDDDINFLRSLASLLAQAGHHPLVAATLDEALGLLQDDAPTAVVLDLKIDHVEPREAVATIRRESPAAALILCSGYPDLVEETVASFPAGAFRAVLTKPFDPERLLALLQRLPRAS
jgi:DNA-binding NtrC family response regulator